MSKTNYWAKFEENAFYHIYNRGINGTEIFAIEENYIFFLRKWKTLIAPFFDNCAYCLIPNHFHFLVKAKTITPEIFQVINQQGTSKSRKFLIKEITYNEFLEDQFKRFFSSYALAFNKQENRTGSLFQKRFKRVLVTDEFRLCHLVTYIHHNPIHHFLAKNYGSWKFCSYAVFNNSNPTLIVREEVLSWYENDLAAFYRYHQSFKLDGNISGDFLEELAS